MESIQELLAGLFGGDVSFFSSLWDIIQGFVLVAGGVIAMVYRHRDTVSKAVAQIKTKEVNTLTEELKSIKTTNAYVADILVTLALSSPVIGEKAKQQIIAYAEALKEEAQIVLEPVTEQIVKLVKETKEPEKVLAEEIANIQETTTKIKEAGETVKDIIESIPL